jgi:hypothetical protein
MAFKVYFKRDLNGETLVIINDNDGTSIQRILKGTYIDTDDETLVKLVLEKFYQEVFPNRAENERFAKMDELFKEANKTLETTRQTLAQSVVKDFEYDALFKDISYKFEFLATHLKVELPTANDDDEEEKNEKDEKESTGDTPKA